MPYKIEPEIETNWNLVSTEERALVETDNHKFHIPPFQIDGDFTSKFIAVGIQVTPSGTNWRFGGYLSQEYSFDSPTYRQSNKAFYKTADLEINNVSLVQLPILTDEPYKLTFFPPTWFRTLRIQVWEYTGTVIDTGGGGGLTNDQLLALAEVIDSNFEALKDRLDTERASDVFYQANVRSRLVEIERKIDFLAVNLLPIVSQQTGYTPSDDSSSNTNQNLGLI